jgi:predicted ATPase/transcriptional regulator with XRE-family HTH domain
MDTLGREAGGAQPREKGRDTGHAERSFGELLRAYRAERGLSQDQLAERAGLSLAAISSLERGVTRWPYRDTVGRLARAMKLAPEERSAFAAVARRPVRARPESPVFRTGGALAAEAETPSGVGIFARNTLPAPLTGLIGRSAEVDRLQQLISGPHARLLTVTGPGGVGKTRLAIAVATRIQAEYPDGVAFAGLAHIHDALLLPTALARLIGIRELTGRDVLDAVCDFMGQRKLLLVLDNCEHLNKACAGMASKLLAGCARLTILATSRMALRLRGEQVFPLEPLALPAATVDSLAAAVERSPAVELFVERAREVYPEFALDVTNTAEVAAICRRLDGLPLAIELAAAQCAYVAPRALLARLTSSLRLLHGSARDLPARQQTLRDTLDWSYNLLSDEARTAFRRLSVFVGGCTPESAAAVCGLHSGDTTFVLIVLENLVAASLLVPARHADNDSRFFMLETIRDYGLERLEECGEGDAVRARHLAWCRALAEQAAPQLTGPDQDEWLDRLEAEHPNLQAALRSAPPPNAIGVRLALALWRFWYTRGYLADGRRWLEAAIAVGVDSNADRASALDAAGMLAWRQGDYEQALAWHAESLVLRRDLGDRHGVASSLENLGMVAWRQSDYQRARALHQESLIMRRELGDQQGTASSLHNLGVAMGEQGEYEQADLVYRESLAIRRRLGDKQGVANSLNSLGLLVWERGDHQQALILHEESLAIVRELGDKKGIANSLNNLGNIADTLCEYERARSLHRESLAIMRELEDRQGIANSVNNLGRIAHKLGDYEDAWNLLAEGLVRSGDIGAKYHVVESLEGLAELAASLRLPDRAARLYGAAAALRRAIGAPLPLRERPGRERALDVLRTQLGAERVAEAWADGEALALDRAISEALVRPPELARGQPGGKIQERGPPTSPIVLLF